MNDQHMTLVTNILIAVLVGGVVGHLLARVRIWMDERR